MAGEQILWVVNQIAYPPQPQYGDADDCWVVATAWAARASNPYNKLPKISTFRAWAGDPDDGVTDGGNLDEVIRGSEGTWPGCGVERFQSKDWAALQALLGEHRPCSIAIHSGKLNADHRFGFMGAHQIGLIYREDGELYLANPLAPQGSRPQQTTWAEIKSAATALAYGPEIRAVLFPPFKAEVPAPEPFPSPWADGWIAGHDKALAAVVERIATKQEDARWIRSQGGYENRELRGNPALLKVYQQIEELNSVRAKLEGLNP